MPCTVTVRVSDVLIAFLSVTNILYTYIYIYIYTLAQIRLPCCTISCLASRSGIMAQSIFCRSYINTNCMCGLSYQEPIHVTIRSVRLSIITTEQVQSNISNLTLPLFGNNKSQPSWGTCESRNAGPRNGTRNGTRNGSKMRAARYHHLHVRAGRLYSLDWTGLTQKSVFSVGQKLSILIYSLKLVA